MSIFNGTADDIFNKKTDYPIGSICMFNTNIDPNKMYGGTWVRIKGKFILGADDKTYPLGSEGGEAKHTLTIAEMPSHSHKADVCYDGTGWRDYSFVDTGHKSDELISDRLIKNSGGGQPHNNMPPYVAFYIWAKVA